MPLGMEIGLIPGDFMLDGDPPLFSKRGPSTQFSTHVYCGQTAGWIKMPLNMEVGLSPGDIVLDGDPAPYPKRGGAPQFSAHVYCGQMAAWIKMRLGTEVGATLCSMWTQLPPPRKKGTPTPPNFWPMSIVAKWLDG